MTDNEKAASYHPDWKPGRRCDENDVIRGDEQRRPCTCGYDGDRQFVGINMGHSILRMEPHAMPAPDMSDPRNYMRALESIVEANKFWGVNLDISTPPECRFEYCAMPIKKWQRDRSIYRDGATVAEAVVKALAALYDAEHAENT